MRLNIQPHLGSVTTRSLHEVLEFSSAQRVTNIDITVPSALGFELPHRSKFSKLQDEENQLRVAQFIEGQRYQ